MKMTKDELLNKVNELEISDEMKISLMEDITDSFEKEDVDLSGYVAKEVYEELLEKYKARFLSGEEKEPEVEEPEELKEEEVIDVKEI